MICPNCQKDVAISEQLYGALYTCGSCQAVYFINFEGQPEFSEVPTGVLSDIVSEPAAQEVERVFQPEQSLEPEINFEQSFESSLEPLVDSVDMISFENKLEAQFSTNEMNPDAPADFQQSDYQNSDLNPFEQPVVEPQQNANSFSRIAKEISDFGNSEAHLSNLNYELQISGLDTQVTMRLFKEIIEDSRFGWDASEILRGVKNGRITFDKLNPVKAFILAKKLQFLDIEKQWKQNAMS